MTKRTHKKIFRGIICGLAGVIPALVFWSLGWLDSWEALTWDWRASLLARPGKATDEIRLVVVDQPSLDWAENQLALPWPWPREIYGTIVNYCRRSGAKALAFAVLFTEFSYLGPEDDEVFGTAISEFGNFAGALALGNTAGNDRDWPKDLPPPKFKIVGLDKWLAQTNGDEIIFPYTSIPIPQVTQNSAVLCNVQQKPDKDGIFRQVKLFGLFDNNVFPMLGLGTYLATNREFQLHIEPGKLTFGDKFIPIDKQSNVILRYRGPSGTYKTYGAKEILQAEIRILNNEETTEQDKSLAEDLKNKYVFFGYTAPGLLDRHPAVVGGEYFSVEIHATVLDNLLSDDFIARVPVWLNVLFVLLLALIYACLASFFRSPKQNALIGIVFLMLPLLSSLGLYLRGFWLPLTLHEMAVAITTLVSLVLNYSREKRSLRVVFQRNVSSLIFDYMSETRDKLQLDEGQNELTTLFLEFRMISETPPPEDSGHFNEYYAVMVEIIKEYGGVIDEYTKDTMKLFYIRSEDPNHAVQACKTAVGLLVRLEKLQVEREKQNLPFMAIEIGINSGDMNIREMKSKEGPDYAITGDNVDLASQLRTINKKYGTHIIFSQSTCNLIPINSFIHRKLGSGRVQGKQKPITIYELIGDGIPSRQMRDFLATFEEGLDAYKKRRWREAIDVFREVYKISTKLYSDGDTFCKEYIRRCEEYKDNPPPEDWDGASIDIN